MKSRTRIVTAVAGTLAIIAVGFTTASASVPDSDDVIHACYTTSSGALRVIDTDNGGSCYSYETAISWPSKAPSLKYFSDTTYVDEDSGGIASATTFTCSDGGLPQSLWVDGDNVLNNGTESLTYPGNDNTKPPTGFSAQGFKPSTYSPNHAVQVNYSIICS